MRRGARTFCALCSPPSFGLVAGGWLATNAVLSCTTEPALRSFTFIASTRSSTAAQCGWGVEPFDARSLMMAYCRTYFSGVPGWWPMVCKRSGRIRTAKLLIVCGILLVEQPGPVTGCKGGRTANAGWWHEPSKMPYGPPPQSLCSDAPATSFL